MSTFAYPQGQSRYRMKMMSIEETFGNLFKPEMKSSGRKLVAQEKISLTTQSDTAIQAYVKVAPPFRVSFSTDGISSPSFTATCSCPVAKKDRFCKHVWATLLCVEEKFPDFLSEKREIERLDVSASPQSGKQASYQESAKLKASEYRKDQYQKQKARIKDKKRTQKGLESALSRSSYSTEVESALSYFTLNGFPMPAGPSEAILTEAKRTLSRVFHPDKGGTHEESVELNQHCQVILDFIRN